MKERRNESTRETVSYRLQWSASAKSVTTIQATEIKNVIEGLFWF